MPLFSKECLDTLRQRIDLVDVLESFIDLKRAGASYKANCPFHEEKTPSFHVQKGDSHYHCFGCGAHGDAIAFLMQHQRFGFSEAVEYLAEKFHVPLERLEEEEAQGPSKKGMKEALEIASQFYHALLLYSEEGREALRYLYRRGIDLDFIRKFQVGYSPQHPQALKSFLKGKHISLEIAEAAGLLRNGKDFFSERIMFPIRAPSGAVIGFSGRKIKETTFGGKYVNTSETPLFKKSRVLFGLNYSRQKIAKERKALIVEGQIDALRLIDKGLDFTVAGQGTAFGGDHAEELIQLGVSTVFLAFDADDAGLQAAAKVGHLFQLKGVEVKVLALPQGEDPDLFLKKRGSEAFLKLISEAEDYLSFLVRFHAKSIPLHTPAGKNEMAQLLSSQVREWNHPLMVHESLRKLASLLSVPESLVGVGQVDIPSQLLYKREKSSGPLEVDPDWVMETEILRGLALALSVHPQLGKIALASLKEDDFHVEVCRQFYALSLDTLQREAPLDLLYVASNLPEGVGQKLLDELTRKKIPIEKAIEHFTTSCQKLLDRNWMLEREKIRAKIQSGVHTDEEASELARQFAGLKRRVCDKV